jgi:hypothetical protein
LFGQTKYGYKTGNTSLEAVKGFTKITGVKFYN